MLCASLLAISTSSPQGCVLSPSFLIHSSQRTSCEEENVILKEEMSHNLVLSLDSEHDHPEIRVPVSSSTPQKAHLIPDCQEISSGVTTSSSTVDTISSGVAMSSSGSHTASFGSHTSSSGLPTSSTGDLTSSSCGQTSSSGLPSSSAGDQTSSFSGHTSSSTLPTSFSGGQTSSLGEQTSSSGGLCPSLPLPSTPVGQYQDDCKL